MLHQMAIVNNENHLTFATAEISARLIYRKGCFLKVK